MQSEKKTYDTYLVDQVKFPFCKGCGHTHSVRYLDRALALTQRKPSTVNLVSDIGCIGLVDALFEDIHTVHTTHGRSTAFATGIEIADSILYDSELKTIVILGDGGATIGLLHIVNAAQMNVDITVIVCNNFLYGMTGGQHSGFTPFDMVTSTTPQGSILPPLDICRIALGCDAGFVARSLATDKHLPEILARAIEYPGFSLVEIIELCPEYGLKRGGLDGKKLKQFAEQHSDRLGVLSHRSDRREFSELYKSTGERQAVKNSEEFLLHKYRHSLDRQIGIVLAGTAGERVQLASYLLMKTAINAGLHVTQKNDNPVTQGSGFSISEIILSPREIYYTGIEYPDAIVVTSEDGLREIRANGMLAKADERTTVIADRGLALAAEGTQIRPVPLRETFGADRAAIGGLGIWLLESGILPIQAFNDEISERFKNEAAAIFEKCLKFADTVKLTKSP